MHLSPHNYVKRDDFWLKGISRHVERISQSAQLDLPILHNDTKYRIFLEQWYLIYQAMIINNLKKSVASCEDWWPNKLRLPSTLITMLPSGSVGHPVSVKRFGRLWAACGAYSRALSHVELPHFKTWRFRSRARLLQVAKNTSPRCLHLQLLFNSEAAVLLACVMTLLVSFVTPSRGQTAFDTAVLLCRCSVRDADSYRRLPFPISSVLVYVWVQIFSHSSFPSDWRIAFLWVKYWCRVQTCAWQLGCNRCDDFAFLM